MVQCLFFLGVLFVLKDHLFQAEEQSIMTSRKASKGGRSPVWMNKEVLTKHRHKKETYRRWK